MIKVLSKCMLVAAVASLAFAGSTTASVAAKMKKAAPAKACTPWTYQTRAPGCTERCGIDGKWYRSAWGWWGACPK